MEKKICSYETLFVVDVTRSDEEQKALIEKFTSLIAENGTVEAVNEWGKRRLAYPINDLLEGFFVNVTFKSEPAFPAELKRIFGITDGILRSMTTVAVAKKAAPAAEKTEAPADAAAE